VSTGLLALCGSEDEAAAMLAIELAHIVLDHAVTQYRQAYNNTIPETAKTEEWFSGEGVIANFGRLAVSMQEDITGVYHASMYNLEADRFASLVLLQAGYEPRALVSVLLKLSIASRSSRGGWLSRQTDLDARVASAASFIAERQMQVAPTYGEKAELRQARFDKAMGR
jgi:predicted Zn-dependent protease